MSIGIKKKPRKSKIQKFFIGSGVLDILKFCDTVTWLRFKNKDKLSVSVTIRWRFLDFVSVIFILTEVGYYRSTDVTLAQFSDVINPILSKTSLK